MVLSRSRLHTELVIVAPARIALSESFRKIEIDGRRHDELLGAMQRFRGSVYAADGALRPGDLTADGRHKVKIDDSSWHVLSLDDKGKVVACLRYLEERHASSFDDLWVRHSALAGSATLGGHFRGAVENEMVRARQMRMGFGEVGGWAVSADHRFSMEPLRIILAMYGLLQILGGCAGVATATFRHASANILRRIGLTSLISGGKELPPYFDPNYQCQMEVLKFDSRFPNPKYRDMVFDFSQSLRAAPVICRSTFSDALQSVLRRMEPVPAMRTPQTEWMLPTAV